MAKKAAPMVMTKGEQQALKRIVDQHIEHEQEVKQIRAAQKKLRTAAYKECGMKPKAIAQLARELELDEDGSGIKELSYHEQKMQVGRAALGINLQYELVIEGKPDAKDREAASEKKAWDKAGKRAAKKNGNGAGEPQHHATNPLHKAKAKTGAKAGKSRRREAPPITGAKGVETVSAPIDGDALLN